MQRPDQVLELCVTAVHTDVLTAQTAFQWEVSAIRRATICKLTHSSDGLNLCKLTDTDH